MNPKTIDSWLYEASDQIRAEDYKDAIRTCKRILRYLPQKDDVRAETLGYMGSAYAMQNKFDETYQTFEQALEITPDNSYFWFDFGLACLHTSRYGKAVRALEQAVALEGDGEMAEQFAEKLALAQKIAHAEMELRGPDFTIEQLVEQQDLFQQAIELSSKKEWGKSENAYRKSITMGDCLPQPWGNLGLTLMMQKRFDEAENAYRRALEHDPNYEIAQSNLKRLDFMRENPDYEPEFQVTSPYADMKASITIVEED